MCEKASGSVFLLTALQRFPSNAYVQERLLVCLHILFSKLEFFFL